MDYLKLGTSTRDKSNRTLEKLNTYYNEKIKEFSNEQGITPQRLGGKISGLGRTILTKYKMEMMADIIKSFTSYNKDVVITHKLYIHITKDIFGKSLTYIYHNLEESNHNKYDKYTNKYIETYKNWKNDNIQIIEEIFGRTPTQEEEEKIKKDKKVFLRVGGKLQEFDLNIAIRRQKEMERFKENTKQKMKEIVGTIAL